MDFRSNVLRMFSGTVVAHALPLLATPLLSRLFEPEAFGLQFIFMALAAAFSVLATCRLDLAMVLAREDEDARCLAGLMLILTTIICGLILLAVVAFAPEVSALAGHPDAEFWLWLLPCMVAAISLFQVSAAFASRNNRFGLIATGNVVNQVGYVVTAFLAGVSGALSGGLAGAKVLGQGISALFAVARIRTEWRRISITAAARRSRELLRHNSQFLVFNTPYSLSGSFMRDLPLLLISAVVSAASTGHFALARMVTSAPATLVSASIGPVFFREAVLHRDTAHLNRLATLLLRDGAIATAPVFAGLMIWGDVLFTTVFGATWAEAGRIAMMLAPAAWWAVQSSWPERLFEVHARQGISLVLQLSADAVTALVFLAMLMGGAEPLTAIVGLAICQLVYHHTYVFTVFRISGFTLDVIARCMGAGWMVFFAFAVPALLLRILFPGSDTAAVIALSSAGAVSVALGLRVFRALSVIQATDAEEPSFQRT